MVGDKNVVAKCMTLSYITDSIPVSWKKSELKMVYGAWFYPKVIVCMHACAPHSQAKY